MDYSKTPKVEEILKNINEASDADKALICKAYEFAKVAHDGQARKSGEPYFNHVVATAINISRLKMDAMTIAAGLMHDVLEDTKVTNAEMAKEFGEEITKLVEGVTKLGTLKYTGKERHVESLRKFFVAMADDIRVVVIKLCDRLHNIQTLQYVNEEKQKRIALETLEIHARLADRLGMGRLKAELEDNAFPYVYKAEYERTKELMGGSSIMSDEALDKVASNLRDELKILDVTIDRVDHRIKHIYSLWQKLKKNNYEIEKVYDIVALRIITPTLADCYQALGVVHGLYRPVPGRFKDYIAVPKPNGYRSLHTTVFDGSGATLEIQIRTQSMHEEAEYGIASHLGYKEIGDNQSKNKIERKTGWTRELLEWQKGVAKHDEFMERLRTDFFEHRVFALTPKGDVIDLPDGSTPIDFAYQIHSDIGNHLAGAFVNNKLVPLDTKLKNRDVVVIETKDSSKPNRKWIDMCKTTIAKRHIKNYLKEHGGLMDKIFVK
jgi:GTP pyrophosphokinase